MQLRCDERTEPFGSELRFHISMRAQSVPWLQPCAYCEEAGHFIGHFRDLAHRKAENGVSQITQVAKIYSSEAIPFSNQRND